MGWAIPFAGSTEALVNMLGRQYSSVGIMSPCDAVFIFERMDLSGGPRMAAHFVDALVNAGQKITVIGPRATNVHPDASTLIEILVASGSSVTVPPAAWLKRFRLWWQVARNAKQIVAVYPADVPLVAFLSLLGGAQAVFYDQNQKHFGGMKWIAAAKVRLLGLLLRLASYRIICVSDAVRDELVAKAGVRAAQTTVVYPGVAASDTLPRGSPSESGSLRLLSVGRIDQQKGQHILIDALRQTIASLPTLTLRIVGDATKSSLPSQQYLEMCQRMVAEHNLGKTITFLGWRRDVPALLADADVYVHSALWEGFPLSVIEAMLSGVPTIFTDCSGRPAGLEESMAIVVPAGDSNALSAAIIQVYRMSPAERVAMGMAGRTYAERMFSLPRIKAQLVAAFTYADGSHA